MAEVDPKLCIALDDINEAMDCENQDNMKVCQNAPLLSFTHKAPTFTSWGFVIT